MAWHARKQSEQQQDHPQAALHSEVTDLHEAARPEDGVVEAAVPQELFRAVLDVHEGHLRVLIAVQDREEKVPARTPSASWCSSKSATGARAGLWLT